MLDNIFIVIFVVAGVATATSLVLFLRLALREKRNKTLSRNGR